MNLRVHIDHLRIDGADLTPADAPRFRDALADELRRLEAERDEAERLQVLAWLDGADVPEPAGPLVIVD